MSAKKSVLVVDDQPGIRALLTEVLAQFGYQVASVKGGQEALHFVAANNPDVVLLDMNMPGMSGVETLRQLRQTHPSLPVILVTAEEGEPGLRQAREFLVSGVINKPFDLTQIANLLENCLA